MAKTKICWRVMDTDNAGIEWGPWNDAEIDEDANANEAAALVNQVCTDQVMGPFQPETPDQERVAAGVLLAANGDAHHGIAWFEDRGHQGATSIIFEWHPTGWTGT